MEMIEIKNIRNWSSGIGQRPEEYSIEVTNFDNRVILLKYNSRNNIF
jgi:hypothetical protein